MTEISENLIYYWLSLSGIGHKKLCAALSICPPAEIFECLPYEKALQSFFGEKHTATLCSLRNTDILRKKWEQTLSQGVKILCMCDGNYPPALRQSEVLPPLVVYYRGDLECLKSPCVGIVGTRTVSAYGKDVAKNFAMEFCNAGVAVVSGLATGVDSYAHEVAVDMGKTVAVLGGGHNYIPAYSANLASKIVSGGGLIMSEYPPDFSPTRYTFPERNRIISGLSLAVVVVEAGQKSGALITADYALEQGRGVFAVPGGIFSPKSLGCNNLLKEGLAQIALSAKDILSELRINSTAEKEKKSYISLDIYEQKLYNLLQSGKKHYDELLTESGFNSGELPSILFSLELKDIIQKLPANNYSLKP